MTTGRVVRLTESYWPADTSVPLLDTTMTGLLREVASGVPDRPALVDAVNDPADRRTWTYAELLADVERTARALTMRFDRGDRIAVWAANRGEWLILQHGIAMAGMLLVAMNPAYRQREIEYVLNQSGATGLFYQDEFRGVDLTEILAEVRAPELRETISFSDWDAFVDSADPNAELPTTSPLDPVQVQYTSGTTGFPKGALLHHKGLVNAARFVGVRAEMHDGAVCINAMPMFHIGGGSVTSMGTLAARGTYVMLPGYDPATLLEAFETYRGTHTLIVPTMLIGVLDHPDRATRDLSSIKTIWTGASPVPASLVERTTSLLGCGVSILFGQTETHGVLTQTCPDDSVRDQAETVGRPVVQLEVKIADPFTSAPVPLGEQGEICARGYQAMLRYFNKPEETAETIDSEGWLHMGDLGSMDDRGFVRVTGRLKDMIIRGGINIYPREIEDVLYEHPAVAEVAVIGVPDEKMGEEIAAVIRLRADADGSAPTGESLKAYCRERLSAHKSPKIWHFVDSLPTTPTGKIQKYKLRELVAPAEPK